VIFNKFNTEFILLPTCLRVLHKGKKRIMDPIKSYTVKKSCFTVL